MKPKDIVSTVWDLPSNGLVLYNAKQPLIFYFVIQSHLQTTGRLL